MELSVTLFNAVTGAPFPTATDRHGLFVLATSGQTFKVVVVLRHVSSILWPEGCTHLRVAGIVDGSWRMRDKFIKRQGVGDQHDDVVVQVILDSLWEPKP